MSKITQEMNESVFYVLTKEQFGKLRICTLETDKKLRIEYMLLSPKQREQLENFWKKIIEEKIIPVLPPDSDKLLAEVHIVEAKDLPVHRIIFDLGFVKYDFIVYRSAKNKKMTVALRV